MTNTGFMAVGCIGLLLSVGTSELAGQTGTSVFSRCIDYARQFEEFEARHQRAMENLQGLEGNRLKVLEQIEQSNRAVGQLLGQKWMQSFAFTAASIQEAALVPQSVRVAEYENSVTPPRRLHSRPTPANQLSQVQVQMDSIRHQMKNVDQAGIIVLKGRLALIEQLKSILSEAQSIQSQSISLFNDYWLQSDVIAQRSEAEWKAALRALDRSSPDNPGALFAQAITRMRLGELDAASSLLDELSQYPPARAVTLAAQAELYTRQKKRDGSSLMRQALALGKDDVRVRMHKAMYHTCEGDLKEAEAEWEAVLKLGTQEVAARRAIALINLSYPVQTQQRTEKAAENAKLAARLAGEGDWFCEITMALTLAAKGDKPKAVEASQKAVSLAISSQRAVCADLADQIQAGQRVVWPF